MAIYTVLTPPEKDGETDPMAFVFVKEGFSWPALFVPELWLIFRRMWLVLFLDIAVGVIFILAGPRFGEALPMTFALLARLLFALEGNELRRWTLRRRGFRLVDVVEGRGIEEAEIRYFAARDAADPDLTTGADAPPAPPPPLPARLGPMPPSVEAGDVVGLFPAPQGGRTA